MKSSGLTFLDRLLTIVVTAALTSMAWIVFGASALEYGDPRENAERASQADAATAGDEPSPDAAEATSANVSEPNDDQLTISNTGAAEGSANLIIPVQGVAADSLSDSFTDDRAGGERLHEAIDIMADEGTPVIAATAGKLEKIFQSDAGGNTLYVRSLDGRTIHYYAHLADYAPGLTEGMRIRRGQKLGSVGSSGNADPSAPHLHYAIMRTSPAAKWWEPATSVNPYPLLGGEAAAP